MRAFSTISEVATALQVPQSMLRYWERHILQIRPLRRKGLRFYRPEDVQLLQGIRQLVRDDGYRLEGVQRIIAARGLPYVRSLGQAQAA